MRYDAVAFLESLFRPAVSIPTDLPAHWRASWEERAAIMEYEGGLPRDLAERSAILEITEQLTAGGDRVTRDCEPAAGKLATRLEVPVLFPDQTLPD
jgi:hypothetical protein